MLGAMHQSSHLQAGAFQRVCHAVLRRPALQLPSHASVSQHSLSAVPRARALPELVRCAAYLQPLDGTTTCRHACCMWSVHSAVVAKPRGSRFGLGPDLRVRAEGRLDLAIGAALQVGRWAVDLHDVAVQELEALGHGSCPRDGSSRWIFGLQRVRASISRTCAPTEPQHDCTVDLARPRELQADDGGHTCRASRSTTSTSLPAMLAV